MPCGTTNTKAEAGDHIDVLARSSFMFSPIPLCTQPLTPPLVVLSFPLSILKAEGLMHFCGDGGERSAPVLCLRPLICFSCSSCLKGKAELAIHLQLLQSLAANWIACWEASSLT